MKCFLFILAGVVAFSPVGRGDTTNSFGLYLTAEPVDPRILARGTGDWSGMRLSGSPVISAADIVSYDFVGHSMRLRPEAMARIPRPPVRGTPFVVVVNGERIYLGAFTTCSSSMSFAVPCITVDRRVIVTNQPPDSLVIERAYPQPSFGAGPDPRGDRRIQAALTALRKLTNHAHVPDAAGRAGAFDEARVLAIARQAVATNDTWLDRAEFEPPKRQPDGSWRVLVWRVPKVPGGHRFISIDPEGRVTGYVRGR